MVSISASKGSFSLKAYRGDAKTLLAFNLADKKSAKNLAGFTIRCEPKGKAPYFIHNFLRYRTPGAHAQDPRESPNSSVNAPIHKFRWLHVPGQVHQGLAPFLGDYTYTVTPRYFDDGAMTPLDPALSATVTITVDRFTKGNLTLGFTRGYTQSQAFVNHFGRTALIRPKDRELLFDTAAVSGRNAHGDAYTFADEYEWLGFTARASVFALVDEVLADKALVLDMFAYDLNEPDLIRRLLALGKQGRVRILLDNAALHHSVSSPKAEDQFETLFAEAAGKDAIVRGKFGRYAHDKVLIVSRRGAKANKPLKVLTGSTNFSVTGLYVNSNHVLLYEDAEVAALYASVFEQAWTTRAGKAAFVKSPWSARFFSSTAKATPATDFAFSPHAPDVATGVLDKVVERIAAEGRRGKAGSVLFAVMEMDNGVSPVYRALKGLHAENTVFSYGISDNPGGIFLYPVGKKSGVLVTGKPVRTQLPPPFNQVPNVGLGHQVHHKFVVCGFNGPNPVVFCGSSNLAAGGEQNNGDNLLAIRDGDIATVFAIEALSLVDHFDFLDRSSTKAEREKKAPPASKAHAAEEAGWFLSTDDKWVQKYFDPHDLHFVDRRLFG